MAVTRPSELTSADYQRHYGSIPSSPGWPPPWNDLPLPRVLRRLFISRPVLFLGCSLNGDRTMDVMARCADQLTGIAHFAALAQPADPELQAPHEAYLAARNILPIWFPPGEFARSGRSSPMYERHSRAQPHRGRSPF